MSEQPPVKIPRVGRPRARAKIAPFAIGLGALGAAVFAGLAGNRAVRIEQASALPPLRSTTMTAPAPSPPVAIPVAAPTVVIPMTSPQPTPPVVAVPREQPFYTSPSPTTRPAPPANDAAERARARASAPALIVDLAPTKSSDLMLQDDILGPAVSPAAALFRTASLQVADPVGASIAAAGPPAEAVTVVAPVVGNIETANTRDLNANERFSARAGNRETEVARAQRLPNQDMLVTQGTIIGAVMETALNSDVPGLARAIVSRDVLSFDGSTVLRAVYAAICPSGTHTGCPFWMAPTHWKRAGGKPATPISSESPACTGIFFPSSTTASSNDSLSTIPACLIDSGPELIAN